MGQVLIPPTGTGRWLSSSTIPLSLRLMVLRPGRMLPSVGSIMRMNASRAVHIATARGSSDPVPYEPPGRRVVIPATQGEAGQTRSA